MSLDIGTVPYWSRDLITSSLPSSPSSSSPPLQSLSSHQFLFHHLSLHLPPSSSSSSPRPSFLFVPDFKECALNNTTCFEIANLNQSPSSSSLSSFFLTYFLRDPYKSDQTSTDSGALTFELTTLPDDMTFGDVNLMSVVVLSILCAVASVGNITVFWTLWKQRRCGSRVNLFIMNLCVADLIVALIMMPLEIAWHATVRWMAGDLFCRVMMFFRAFGPYLSSNVLVVISLDRYMTITRPLSLHSANKRSRVMVSLAWAFSVIYSIPQSIIFHLERHPIHEWFHQCVTFNSNYDLEMTYNIFSLFAIYLFPLIVIVVSYSLILRVISARNIHCEEIGERVTSEIDSNGNRVTNRYKFNNQLNNRNIENKFSRCSATAYSLTPGILETSLRSSRRMTTTILGLNSSARIIQQARSRTLKMTIVIVSVFIICWTPYFVMSTWYWFHYNSASQVHPTLQKVLFLFAMSNSCVDPIVYGMFSTAFRKSSIAWFMRLKRNFCNPPDTNLAIHQSFK